MISGSETSETHLLKKLSGKALLTAMNQTAPPWDHHAIPDNVVTANEGFPNASNQQLPIATVRC